MISIGHKYLNLWKTQAMIKQIFLVFAFVASIMSQSFSQCIPSKYGIVPVWPSNWGQQDKNDWWQEMSNHGMGYIHTIDTWRGFQELADSGKLTEFKDNIELLKSTYGFDKYNLLFQNPATYVNPMPPLYCGSPLTDTAVSNTMYRFVTMLLDTMHTVVDYFTFGGEADVYFKIHPEQMDSFVSLASRISNYIDQNYPSIQFGVTLTFRYGIQTDQTLWNKVKGFTDILVVTYWPINADYMVNPSDIDSVQANINDLIIAAEGKQIIIKESGLPTHDSLNSDENLQTKFIRKTFEYTAGIDQIEVVGFDFLADFSTEMIQYYQNFYLNWDNDMRWYFESIGLMDTLGNPKPAYPVYIEMLDSVCALNPIAEIEKPQKPIMYPNPCSDIINIKLPPGWADVKCMILDSQGRTVSTKTLLNDKENCISVLEFAAGIYYIGLFSPGELPEWQSIIKTSNL